MIANTQPALRIVLYDGPGSQPLSAEEKRDVVRTSLESGYEVCYVGSSGELEIEHQERFLVLGRFDGEHPYQSDDPESQARFYFADLAEINGSLDETLERYREAAGMNQPGKWKPWFPTIDLERCTNCLQCLSFCLFDVYGTSSDGHIEVKNPEKCKTDCPACSRVCPEVAIIFPKYKAGPINGDQVNQEDLEREKMKVDISSLLGGDIYKTLRDRNVKAKSRFSKERDEDRALKERKLCLAKLKKELDIPDEVLASLPSMDQIQNKAERMKAMADKGESARNPAS